MSGQCFSMSDRLTCSDRWRFISPMISGSLDEWTSSSPEEEAAVEFILWVRQNIGCIGDQISLETPGSAGGGNSRLPQISMDPSAAA